MTILHLVTMPRTDEPICDDRSYTCPCAEHVAEREALVARGVREFPQPWQVRKAA